VSILINNAGVQRRHKAEEFPLADWDLVVQVQLRSVFLLCQGFGRRMLQRSYGKIINIASLVSFSGGMYVPAYAAAKGGVAQLTKALANEWAARGVNVNAVAPGYMATEMNTALMADPTRSAQILDRIPAKRWGTPGDMAGIVVFLASRASAYIHGGVFTVDGGWMAR
jgi:2-deoxy-D-gluconate 3-dehydrogenase